jgi:hypothetical protein
MLCEATSVSLRATEKKRVLSYPATKEAVRNALTASQGGISVIGLLSENSLFVFIILNVRLQFIPVDDIPVNEILKPVRNIVQRLFAEFTGTVNVTFALPTIPKVKVDQPSLTVSPAVVGVIVTHWTISVQKSGNKKSGTGVSVNKSALFANILEHSVQVRVVTAGRIQYEFRTVFNQTLPAFIRRTVVIGSITVSWVIVGILHIYPDLPPNMVKH